MNYLEARFAIYNRYFLLLYLCHRKISDIHKRLCHKKYDPKKLRLYRNKWAALSKFVIYKYYSVYTTISGKDDINYVPENIYYMIIEPSLNDCSLSKAYANKNSYDKLPFPGLFPKTFIRNIDGVFYGEKYDHIASCSNSTILNILNQCNATSIIVKPAVDSMGGKKVQLFLQDGELYKNANGDSLDIDYLKDLYVKNYVIQEFIEQHEFYKQFNSSSLNTIRVFTYRSVETEQIEILHAVQRMGIGGSITDNQSSGGISCGIHKGILNTFAIDKKGQIFTYGGEKKGFLIKGSQKVYKYDEIVKKAQEVAKEFLYHRLLSFDFCIDQNDNVRLIEINNVDMEINFLQMNNGPLFGKYTDEVIAYCRNNHKTKR